MNFPSEYEEPSENRSDACHLLPPQALLFEPANVLHDATVWNRWLWQLLGRMGMDWEFPRFCRTWQDDYLTEVYRGNRDFADAFRAFLMDSGFSAGQVNEVEAASAARRRELCESIRPLPGVVKTLNRLASLGIPMGVLADTELAGPELHERFVRLRLSSRFRFIHSSIQLRSSMPSEAGYQLAINSLGLPAHSIAFIGCAADDLAGAAAVGMRTIAVNQEAGAQADYYLNRLDELIDLCFPAERALAASSK